MCVIVYKPADKIVSKRQLLNCWKANPEGAGFMWSDGDSLFIEKGFFRFRKLYRSFRRIERTNLNSAFIIHFRKASVGSVNKDNCHPFYFKKNRFGFAHNGTLTDWIESKEAIQSDSVNFTNKLLEKLPDDFDKNVGIRFLLGKYASHHSSKFIFMNCMGEIILCNKQQWEEQNGVIFSNNAYLGPKAFVKSQTAALGVHNWSDKTYDFTKQLQKQSMWQPCSKCGAYNNASFGNTCWKCSNKNLVNLQDSSRFLL